MKDKIMNCPKCNSKFIWGTDFDDDGYIDDIWEAIGFSKTLERVSCSKCDVTALIYIPDCQE